MPLQATSGAASYDAFGGGVAVVPNYIEDVFSTWLYEGNNDNPNTITNGIDLAGKGGLVWIKSRSGAYNHGLIDTVRGRTKELHSNTTGAQDTCTGTTNGLTSFNSNGFTLGASEYTILNSGGSSFTYASWTFRKQPKFFDIVSINSSTTTYNHNLGSTPGCIMVKCTSASGANWVVYHRSLSSPTTQYINLNTTGAATTYGTSTWSVSSTQFSVDPTLWANGTTGIAYLFAHDAGGFGLTGTDNVISCGSYVGDGAAGRTVTLGYEPQWLLIKRATNDVGNWNLFDNMRGFCDSSSAATSLLLANTSGAESTGNSVGPTATGFQFGSGAFNNSGSTFIYIAIRRGPMKVPSTGTSVFAPLSRTGTGTTATVTGVGFAPDMYIATPRTGANVYQGVVDKLRGKTQGLVTSITAAETTASVGDTTAFGMDGISLGVPDQLNMNLNGQAIINWFFRRAPSFMDVVCFTGTGSYAAQTHNLGVAPELVITKTRSTTSPWYVVRPNPIGKYLSLNTTAAEASINFPATSTTVSVIDDTAGSTYVYYLFATCAGVSKVGSYTGTGTTKQIDCGFTAGARFVLIKRTDSTGDWYVWDTARGIVAGNDSYLLLNSTAAEVTSTDYIDTYSAGFEISSTAPAAINANGGSFIFFAVA
jgi:hypothetical protein